MIQRIITLIALFTLAATGVAYTQQGYTYQADLSQMKGKRLAIKLTVPPAGQDVINFVFPTAVPGYYQNGLQSGRLVYNLQAMNLQHQPLPVEQLSFNRWRIKDATALRYIEYEVEDVWNHKGYAKWPAAENLFVQGKAYLLNPAALFGYMEGKENFPFYIYLTRPPGLFAASGLNIRKDASRDAFSAGSFQELAGKPILYTNQEPVSFQVANTTLEIGVFSEKKAISPQRIQQALEPMFTALAHYMGGVMPVDKYAFLFFFYNGDALKPAMLAHHNSSVMAWPEQWGSPKQRQKAENLEAELKKAAFSAFLHSLSVHAAEMRHFDFDTPSGSDHLWLYEGMPEYLGYHAQASEKLITEEVFNWFINDMLAGMKDYRQDVPLTDISRGVFGDMANQQGNIMFKGFVVNLLLDIRLRQWSGGKTGLKQLAGELAARYSSGKTFKDSELFDIVAGMTSPQAGAFLKACAGGAQALPLKDVFGLVGYEYDPTTNKVRPKEEATEKELALRQAWLFGE
ncbi:MAG: hypothetical protein KDC66_00245 [Phaeodactylibacter sp.]|nr:hypothetical protein [Phaeodactylibacter sp.]